MDKYVILKVPFGSKNYIQNKPNKKGMYCKGNAYYVFDLEQGVYIDEYLQIDFSNFRLTDHDLLHSKNKLKDKGIDEPTEYYLKNDVKNFRDKYLDVYSNNTNPNSITDLTYQMLSTNQVDELNKFFICSNTTIRTMYSYLSGSNFTGAETNNKASQILCIDYELSGCNFLNPIKKYEGTIKQITKNYPKDLKTYSISEFIDKKIIKNFESIFYEYNIEEFFKGNDYTIDYIDDAIESYMVKNTKKPFEVNDRQKFFIESIVNKTMENYDEYMKTNKLDDRLRSFYTSNINASIKNHSIPIHSTKTKFNLRNVVNAHIIPFSELKNKGTIESLKAAINPYNCIRIDQSTHNMWDKKELYFDKYGTSYYKNGKQVAINYLNVQEMPLQTKIFFKQYLNENSQIIERITHQH